MRGRAQFLAPGWGVFDAVWQADKLLFLDFYEEHQAPRPARQAGAEEPFFLALREQVLAYLEGRLRRFDIPVQLDEQPPFRYRLWQETMNIPYGTVLSYGGLAGRAGSPRAARAAGSAMRQSPLFLIMPCHRVVAAGNRLGCFGGYPELKARLLALEGIEVTPQGRLLL